jgi:hypothetical protein
LKPDLIAGRRAPATSGSLCCALLDKMDFLRAFTTARVASIIGMVEK